VFWLAGRLRQELSYSPLLYVNAHYAAEYLLDSKAEHGEALSEHGLGLEGYGLVQPHYGPRQQAPTRERLERGPGGVTPGWSHRVGWQLWTEYLGGLDLCVVDFDACTVPAGV